MKNIESEYLLFSYNNEGLLSKANLIEVFNKYYKNVTLYEKDYKKFKAQKSVKKKRVIEYLFICDNNDKKIEDELLESSIEYETDEIIEDKTKDETKDEIIEDKTKDYTKMTVKELKKECKKQKKEKYSKLKKQELFNLLNNK